MIAIIPTDSEGDSQTNDSISKDLTTSIYSRRTHDSDGVKSTNIQNLNDEGIMKEFFQICLILCIGYNLKVNLTFQIL